jgi:hypothetical protein
MLFIIPIRNFIADNILEKCHEVHNNIHNDNSSLAPQNIAIYDQPNNTI